MTELTVLQIIIDTFWKMCSRNKKWLIEIIWRFVCVWHKIWISPKKDIVINYLQCFRNVCSTMPISSRSSNPFVRENRAGPKRWGRFVYLHLFKVQKLSEKITFMTVCEVRARVSSRYYNWVLLISSGLNEPNFQATLAEPKTYFIKIPESLNWHILEVFWLVLRGSKYLHWVVYELALLFIYFQKWVSLFLPKIIFVILFLHCYRYPV